MLKLESRSVEHNPARTAGTESQPGSSMRDTRTTAAPKFLKRIRTILIDNSFVNQCTLHCTKCVNEQMPFTRAYFLFFFGELGAARRTNKLHLNHFNNSPPKKIQSKRFEILGTFQNFYAFNNILIAV